MKLKWIVGIIVAVIIVVVAWRTMPGLRTRAQDTYSKVGGWTEQARQKDPVGFMDYAAGRLQKHLAALKGGRVNIKDGLKRIETETARNRDLLARSGELAATFRAAFKAAETAAAFPATVAGSSYSRNELIEQVRLVLLQRGNYGKAIEDLAAAVRLAQEADLKLLRQVTDTQAALAALPAKKEIVRVNKVAGEVQELLSQIDALIDRNETVLEGAPVRTVEELLATAAPAAAAPDVDVMAFLEGSE